MGNDCLLILGFVLKSVVQFIHFSLAESLHGNENS